MRFSIATAYLGSEELGPIAKAADEAGYHGMAVADHVINLETLTTPYPYTEDGKRRWEPFTPWLDPWVTIGALGAVTERLQFFTNVYVLPMRDPFTIAKQVSTASALTGGRVALGVGMGWCEEEFDLLGQAFRKRGARADEMLELLRALWSGEWVEHHGEFYDVPRLEMTPAAPDVPIYVGGLSKAAISRAARNDGWISDLISIDQARDFRARIDAERAELGKADEPFSMIVSLNDAVTVDQFARAEEAGVTDNLTMPWAFYGGFDISLQQKIDGLHRFADDIMAKLPG
ncbi:TIGR03619 family F420-dependent LLM class oxidoreductase [Aquihabitans sp. G128]|uniref:TIGR03619 family F420-dependent LLM class oxidoreductase n=1 Tax=Aquihabitans sp. G128 TaxID=2849779 RepID=UPI001C226047|nr:TIGR03619 family F420-dependent LLM class oxidoreductase [Aquihabitans sp. G128]QXC62803.1 TIGR03619 family F420-dependent LLM class oxidoreductase [Aquihabitans sp. G128]